MRNLLKITLFFIALSGTVSVSGQEVRARVKGLETDSLYMSLLAEEHLLQTREDSLMTIVRQERQRFASDTTNFHARSQHILQMEESVFGIRNKMGALTSKINHIEQEFILNNLSNPNSSVVVTGSSSSNHPNLIDNDYFKENLSPQEYRELKDGERHTPELEKLVKEYKESYKRIEAIAQAYDNSPAQAASDSIYNVYRAELALIRRLETNFNALWGEQYNQEIYIYSYLLDKLHRMKDLAELNEKAINRRIDADEVMSDVFAEYPLQKEILIDYQLALTEALSLTAAKETLMNARRKIAGENLLLPKIKLEEKEFVKYEFVSFPDVVRYNNDNPIPELEIPESGTYYSVTVGLFQQRQPVSLFRGAAPLYYEKLRNGQWRYYAGMFRSYGDAADAVQELKNAGFRRPEAVRWTNRSFENLSAQAAKAQGNYRIVITVSQGDLPEEARFLLERYARSKEISRVGSTFYIGTFTDKIHVDEVVRVLEKVDGLRVSMENLNE